MCDADSLFAKMFQRKVPAGSSSQALKVDKPDEFDINICLKLPVRDQCSIEARGRSRLA